MNKGQRTIAVAISVILFATEGRSQVAAENELMQEVDPIAADDGGEGNSPYSIDLSSALGNIESAIRDLAAEEDKIAAQELRARQNRDLSAQEGMAHWAQAMFWATAATVILTLLALCTIIITLHHTKRAADYTRDMLDEARNATSAAVEASAAANKANKILKMEQRPWLHLEIGFCMLKIKGTYVEIFGAKVNMRNIGKTPARNVRVAAFPVRDDVSVEDILSRNAVGLIDWQRDILNWPKYGVIMPEEITSESLHGRSEYKLGGLCVDNYFEAPVKLLIIVAYTDSLEQDTEVGALQYFNSTSYSAKLHARVRPIRQGGSFSTEDGSLVLHEKKSEREAR